MPLCEPKCLCTFVLRIRSGPRVKFTGSKSTDRSKSVVPVLFLFCVALWLILRGSSCLVYSCFLFSCCITPFSIVITSHEPPHDKTNKVTVRPAKTQISLGIRPV